MSQQQKQVVSYSELLEKLQGLLKAHPEECRNIHIDDLQVFQEPVEGANWTVRWLRSSGDDHDQVACRKRISADLDALRTSFDVDPDS